MQAPAARRAPALPAATITKLLLAAGVVAPVVWVLTDVVASLLYDGYSMKTQTISELAAIDAPTRSFALAMVLLYLALVLVFALGVWRSAAGRGLRAIAVLLALNAAFNLVLTPFSSMHQRDVLAAGGGTVSDSLHLAITTTNVLTFLLVVVIGARALGARFGAYSIATLGALLLFGILTGLEGTDMSNNEPTPWIGVTERISAYAYMLWSAVLAIALILAAERTRVDRVH
jgi:hypothetical protein